MSHRVARRWSIRRLAVALFPAVLTGILIGCGSEPKTAPVAQAPTATTSATPTPAADSPPGSQPAEPAQPGKERDADSRPTLERDAATKEQQKRVELVAGRKKEANKDAPGPIVHSPVPQAAAPGIPASTLPAPTSGTIANHPATAGQGQDRRRNAILQGVPKPEAKAGEAPLGAPAVPPAADPRSGESYNMYRENEYRSPLVAPLSTFSADVNTASYSNVRRILDGGHLPPKDAVFLAEFVNYFPYDYAKPKPNTDPIAYNLELGPCPWNRKHHLLRVGVQAFTLDPKEMPARRFTFLVDTSGSMSDPNKLPLVKQSLGLLIDQLDEKDSVGLVTYAGTAGVALAPTPGSEKAKIRAAVEGLGAGGSTNGEGGLKAAYELALASFDEKGVNRVILCTDGDFNVGVFDQGELVRMIEARRKSGIFLTILGYGMGNYKDGTLKELANHGNGHHAYIDSLAEAKKVFVEQGGALVLVAKDVKFQVDFNPARVAAYRLVGYENRLLKDEDFKNDAKDAGDMGSGHQVTVLYEIVPVGVDIALPGVDKSKYQIPTKVDPNAPDEWMTVKMRYKQPDGNTSKELARSLKGDVKVKDLSEDFRFAAAAASFGMLLRDSEFKGGMTYAGVIEEAQGAVGADPSGHRKAFVDLVKKAQDLKAATPNTPAAPEGTN